MKIPAALFIVVLLAAAVFALGCVYGWYRNRKMYRIIDRMLDEILDGEPVSQSDIREGEISALAAKAKRIQEKVDSGIIRAEEEKEQLLQMEDDDELEEAFADFCAEYEDFEAAAEAPLLDGEGGEA